MKAVSRFVPAGSLKVASKHSPAVAYLFDNSRGNVCVIGYFGNAEKASFHHSFKTEARRASWVAGWFRERDAQAARKAAAVAEHKAKMAAPHALKVGDVMRCSWGYDQTNIDYFQVVELVGKRHVVIREIYQETVGTDWLQGKCVPVKDSFKGEPMRKVVSAHNSVRIHSFASAYKVEPVKVAGVAVGFPTDHWTAYA